MTAGPRAGFMIAASETKPVSPVFCRKKKRLAGKGEAL
jgi:hypothetical protein